jgi:tetratricopeptide (TPR) repeat protein
MVMRIKIDLSRLLLISTAVLFCLPALWFAFRILLGEISFRQMDEKGLVSAASIDSRNATYQYALGRFYHYSSDAFDLHKAIRYYRNSLRQSPLQAGCWLDLSKAYLTAGITKEAEAALERSVGLNPRNSVVMWETGIFFLMSGSFDIALKAFKKFILLEPETQEDVYDMFWKLRLDPNYILSNLIPESYPYYRGYLLYLISTDRITESEDLWKRMEFLPKEDELFLRYIEFLISKNLYEEAEKIWKIYTEKKYPKGAENSPSVLWNGSFDLNIENSGFDWKVRKAKGVKVFLDRDIHLSGDRSLGIIFDGTENPDITIASQIVRVIPGTKYFLTGYFKTSSLTTTNGLFFLVEGHDCKDFHKYSDMVTGTNLWRELTIEFETPPDCSVISVNIRRERSSKFDNKISGIAWIDKISMVQR